MNLTYEEHQAANAAINDLGGQGAAFVPSAPVAETAVQTPVAETAVQTPVAETAVHDSAGMPWDARIHSGKNAATSKPKDNGEWKRKKNISDELYESVMQELRTTIPPNLIRTADATPPVQQPVQQTAPTDGPNVNSLIVTAQQYQCRTDIPHEAMMTQSMTALQDPNNIVTATDIPAICGAFGIQSLPDCINNPELIGKIYYILGGQ